MTAVPGGWPLRFRRAARLPAIALIGLLTSHARPAAALQFDQVAYKPGEVIIVARGPIIPGDDTRLTGALAGIPKATRVFALALDSPGGSVAEAELLAGIIRHQALPVVVSSNSTCASACFLLLAAATRRSAAMDALIGVHSASDDGQETTASLAATTEMARYASQLGVPPLILGKMVQTTPGRVEWLTKSDLVSMGVAVFDASNAPSAPAPSIGATIPRTAGTPVASAPSDTSAIAASRGFVQGNADRRAWDTWLAAQRGAYRDGAASWESRHEAAQAASCSARTDGSGGEFLRGCEAARKRLAAADARRATDPDYRNGWNAVLDTQASDTRPEAEFRGAFFCARGPATVSLKVVVSAASAPRKAIFSFGPTATNRNVSYGTFVVEGRIDLAGGLLELHPVSWIAQPAGYEMVGLQGRSGDGGRTFAGRVTDAAGCTLFTLRRQR
jgi:hypothetical protein